MCDLNLECINWVFASVFCLKSKFKSIFKKLRAILTFRLVRFQIQINVRSADHQEHTVLLNLNLNLFILIVSTNACEFAKLFPLRRSIYRNIQFFFYLFILFICVA